MSSSWESSWSSMMTTSSSANDSPELYMSGNQTFIGLSGTTGEILAACLTVGCVLGAGLASGLNLCLLSLDPAAVEATAVNPEVDATSRARAKKVGAILHHQHWMLVTTLIWNALFVESLPLTTQALISNPFVVVAISTLSVLIFGEIIPQSFFTRYALAVASFLSPVVWALMILSSPVSVPIAKLLDWVVGHRPQMAMKRVELRELISLNAMAAFAQSASSDDANNMMGEDTGLLGAAVEPGAVKPASNKPNNQQRQQDAPLSLSTGDEHQFSADETALLNGALNLSEKTVRDAMHPNELLENLFMLEENQVLTRDVAAEINKCNKTRIPVYQNDRRNIVGFIFSHSILHIIFMKEENAPRVKECGVTAAARCNASDLVVVLFRPFLSDAQDIAVVHDDATGLPIGIVTKWDMLSFLFNDEIRSEKWSPLEAEMLAAQMQREQRHRFHRESMVRSSAMVSSSLKNVSTANNTSFGSNPGAIVSSGGMLSHSSSQEDLRRTTDRLSGYGSTGGAAAAAASGAAAASADDHYRRGSSQQPQQSRDRQRSSAFGSQQQSRRTSHYVPGAAERRKPSFCGNTDQ